MRAEAVICFLIAFVGACLASVESSQAAPALLARRATAQFTVVPSPNPNPIADTINGLGILSPTDAWAVGFQNSDNLNGSRSLALHWSGGRWNVTSTPNPGVPGCATSNFGNVLNAVAPVAANDVWAVGFTFNCRTAILRPLVLHWNGSGWSVVATPALRTNDNAALNGIYALATDNIWAVGYHPAPNGAVLPLIEHWNGRRWTQFPESLVPRLASGGNPLNSVSATSPQDIWAVGDAVTPSNDPRDPNQPVKTFVLHFDGRRWSIIPSPNPLPTGVLNQNVLNSVVAVAPNDVTAVGYILDFNTQRVLTLIEHWNGSSFQVVASPNPSSSANTFNALKSVTARAANDLYAVGSFANGSTNGNDRTLIEHFDGGTWSLLPAPTRGVAQQLNGVASMARGPVWAGGAFSVNGTNPEGNRLIVPRTLTILGTGP